MKKTVVLNVVALSQRVIGEHTPFLKQWSDKRKKAAISPVLPAVTCSSQSAYLTGKWPKDNGIVGNGWYFKDECEIKFWRQSNHLVQSPKVWDDLKAKNPDFTCANMFWWYNMYSSVDFAVTPRPLYPSDGRKLPDIHSQPMELRDRLQKELGQFPLFSFWGPNANITSSQWIADASLKVDEWYDPTLTLIYLPHLDYALQKFGIDFEKISTSLNEIDALCEQVITYYERKGAEVLLLSEYGITSVNQPVHINRALRKAGYIQVKDELGLETLDAGTSGAFAVADHQLAHVYVNKPEELAKVKKLLSALPGVEKVLDKQEQEAYRLNHDRSGDLVAVADKDSWFTYYYWLDDKVAPDYARTVDIHRKPGYDPVEMFANPDIKFLKGKLGWTLLKKKLGFRYLMDVIPLKAELVKGSHGRIPEDKADWPVLIGGKQAVENEDVAPTDVYSVIYGIVNRK
ncbi:alkaline phosphatase family protein [Cyclobacterium marinum]|uniref:Type I phosphodiesterase/nucleotide pyrophosphatase n=1 Tax=Cyclobacterium marinum (strain ATCC 25205 / DSM 745 / LMG 13164 / NCIMB 1802) TaxID=880070 RepID=G0J102_CYCMS|nr:nucleotide pyrophosphatase/phosphodiesterase family protein [Cyclobacterium marinum]AEL25128.1 type I phosphodiesterase/nucleotide pyrophosphatase [Cyclobacterium marinum DSM 745]